MRVLVAEDDNISRRLLQVTLTHWGYQPELAADGTAAWAMLQRPDAPALAILDWMMPGLDGIDVVRLVREANGPLRPYLLMLTTRNSKEDLVAGLEAGADDYITKPFEREELRARMQVGARLVELQRHLRQRVEELEEALTNVKQLQGLLPICSYCKKIRDDGNYWHKVESYIVSHSEASFTHGVCPECFERVRAEMK